MNLFFETERQAVSFLWMIPLGISAAFFLDIAGTSGKFQILIDVAVFLLAGISVLYILVLNHESDLRLYHLLGFLIGAILYLLGLVKIIRWFRIMQESAFRTPK